MIYKVVISHLNRNAYAYDDEDNIDLSIIVFDGEVYVGDTTFHPDLLNDLVLPKHGITSLSDKYQFADSLDRPLYNVYYRGRVSEDARGNANIYVAPEVLGMRNQIAKEVKDFLIEHNRNKDYRVSPARVFPERDYAQGNIPSLTDLIRKFKESRHAAP